MRSRLLFLAAAAAALAAHPAAAQDDDPYYGHHRHHQRDRYDDDDGAPPRSYLGGELTIASPQGEFANYVGNGFGGGLHYLLRLDRDGWLALRADASLLNYGHERQRVLLSPTIGGRVSVDLTTDNNIAFFGFGPQIGVPTGALRPYLNGFAGVSYIFTESSVGGSSSSEAFASTTNFDDASFAYGGGAGLYVPLGRSRNPVSLDLGVAYRHNGTAEYLRHGDITDNPDGSITLHPVFSETNLLTFHVGVSVGLR
jgi:opacity protein-like surface antigen